MWKATVILAVLILAVGVWVLSTRSPSKEMPPHAHRDGSDVLSLREFLTTEMVGEWLGRDGDTRVLVRFEGDTGKCAWSNGEAPRVCSVTVGDVQDSGELELHVVGEEGSWRVLVGFDGALEEARFSRNVPWGVPRVLRRGDPNGQSFEVLRTVTR